MMEKLTEKDRAIILEAIKRYSKKDPVKFKDGIRILDIVNDGQLLIQIKKDRSVRWIAPIEDKWYQKNELKKLKKKSSPEKERGR